MIGSCVLCWLCVLIEGPHDRVLCLVLAMYLLGGGGLSEPHICNTLLCVCADLVYGAYAEQLMCIKHLGICKL